MNKLINAARHIPVDEPVSTISITPVMLDAAGRPKPIEMRITAPMQGRNLPIILLSHGHGPSLYIPSKDGYGPLANFYAEHGFVVIQRMAIRRLPGLTWMPPVRRFSGGRGWRISS